MLDLLEPSPQELIAGYLTVSDAEATETTRRLAMEEGIFGGFSGGANVAAALQVLQSDWAQVDGGKTVCAVICDSGMKYLSTDLWDRDSIVDASSSTHSPPPPSAQGSASASAPSASNDGVSTPTLVRGPQPAHGRAAWVKHSGAVVHTVAYPFGKTAEDTVTDQTRKALASLDERLAQAGEITRLATGCALRDAGGANNFDQGPLEMSPCWVCADVRPRNNDVIAPRNNDVIAPPGRHRQDPNFRGQ